MIDLYILYSDTNVEDIIGIGEGQKRHLMGVIPSHRWGICGERVLRELSLFLYPSRRIRGLRI